MFYPVPDDVARSQGLLEYEDKAYYTLFQADGVFIVVFYSNLFVLVQPDQGGIYKDVSDR